MSPPAICELRVTRGTDELRLVIGARAEIEDGTGRSPGLDNFQHDVLGSGRITDGVRPDDHAHAGCRRMGSRGRRARSRNDQCDAADPEDLLPAEALDELTALVRMGWDSSLCRGTPNGFRRLAGLGA